MKRRISPAIFILMVAGAAAIWKVLLLALDCFPFNADEAVVGLMARHILSGERPIFFYGQAYMGSLDAFLVAGGFALFGQQVWVIRAVQSLLYLGTIITTIWIGKRLFSSWRTGLLAGVLLAFPTVNVMLYTTASLGGYGEALLIGNLLLIAGLRIADDKPAVSFPAMWAVFGILAGLGLWANGLTLIYSVPVAFLLVWSIVRECKETGQYRGWLRWAIALLGFFLGSLPWWLYAFQRGWQALVLELLGSAVAVEGGSYLEKVISHAINFVILGGTVTLGFRPPWGVSWLGLPLIPFVLIFWCLGGFIFLRRLRRVSELRPGGALLAGMIICLASGFIFTSFGIDPSGRYFVPLAVPMALVAADAIQQVNLRRRWQYLIVGGLILFHVWGTLQCALQNPPGITTQFSQVTQIDTRYQKELIMFLQSQGETCGYSNYWVAYPTAFLSGEDIILAPRLPYHQDLRYTARDDRYAPYGEQVSASSRVAYVTTHNPVLDERLKSGFVQNGVTWKENRIGDYQIYYQLSRPVRPTDLKIDEVR